MAKQFVMDPSLGDARYEFDTKDATAVAEAEKRFMELTGAGFTAGARVEGGKTVLTRKFDPNVEETVFFPRLQGG